MWRLFSSSECRWIAIVRPRKINPALCIASRQEDKQCTWEANEKKITIQRSLMGTKSRSLWLNRVRRGASIRSLIPSISLAWGRWGNKKGNPLLPRTELFIADQETFLLFVILWFLTPTLGVFHASNTCSQQECASNEIWPIVPRCWLSWSFFPSFDQ